MTGDYLKAVAATLNAMRRLAEDPPQRPGRRALASFGERTGAVSA